MKKQKPKKQFNVKKLKSDVNEYFYSGKHTRHCELAAFGVCTCAAHTTFGCGCPVNKIRKDCESTWQHG